jgi:hypothetical protein
VISRESLDSGVPGVSVGQTTILNWQKKFVWYERDPDAPSYLSAGVGRGKIASSDGLASRAPLVRAICGGLVLAVACSLINPVW